LSSEIKTSTNPASQRIVQRAVQDLTPAQRVTVRRSLSAAIGLCNIVLGLGDDRVGELIGQFMHARSTASRLAGIRYDFQRIRDALARINPDNVVYDEGEDCFAYVRPGDPTRIYLGDDFWTSVRRGRDSTAGTFVHEASHWYIGRGTDDHAYGDDIGELSYTLARNNADTLERIAENA